MEQLFNGPDEHWVNVEGILGNLCKLNKSTGDEIWDMCLINKAFMGEHGIEVDKVVPFKFSKSLEERSCYLFWYYFFCFMKTPNYAINVCFSTMAI